MPSRMVAKSLWKLGRPKLVRDLSSVRGSWSAPTELSTMFCVESMSSFWVRYVWILRNSTPLLPGMRAASVDCCSRDESSVWNHTNKKKNKQNQKNTTHHSHNNKKKPKHRSQRFLRMAAHGVTPIPGPIS